MTAAKHSLGRFVEGVGLCAGLGALLLATACSSAPPPKEPAAPPVAVAKPPPPPKPKPSNLPPEIARKLGQKCEPAPSAMEVNEGPICGKKNRVAGLYLGPDGLPKKALAEGEEWLTVQPHGGRRARSMQIRYLEKEGQIRVQRLVCGGCRRRLGWAFVGNLSALTPRQDQQLQRKLGLSGDAPLGDAASWKAAVSELAPGSGIRPLPSPGGPPVVR